VEEEEEEEGGAAQGVRLRPHLPRCLGEGEGSGLTLPEKDKINIIGSCKLNTEEKTQWTLVEDFVFFSFITIMFMKCTYSIYLRSAHIFMVYKVNLSELNLLMSNKVN
jgi:hypothetical protein